MPKTPESPSTDVAKLLSTGQITKISELLKKVVPPTGEHDVPVPPLPSSLASTTLAAVAKLPDVFGKVQPTERRELTPVEVGLLHEERDTLKVIDSEVGHRLDAIRSTLYHHFDVKIEEEDADARTTVETDKDGFYLREGVLPIKGTDQCFKRETRNGTTTLSPMKLLDLVESGDLSKEDYLAMTTQTRVVDENKVMLLLKKKPDLLSVITKAADAGRNFTQLWVRKNPTR